jgi:hypothetical protein
LKPSVPVFLLFAIALPMLSLAQEPDYTAMTADQRWNDYISTSILSPSLAFRSLASAAISHASKDPVQWGQGSRGYFERAGSHWARYAVQGSIHSGLAAALGHDTRYFREPEKNGWHRSGHALRRTLFTRNREGHTVFDVSQLAGLYGAPMAASLWIPRRLDHRSVLNEGVRAGTFGIGMQAGSNMFKEFGPDLKRAILHK